MSLDEQGRVGRNYRGGSPDERAEQRRRRLVEAAITVYGDAGYSASTVQAVCEAAGLTKRYFYESFESSEELLAACLLEASRTLMAELAEEAGSRRGHDDVRPRAILKAFFSAIRADPKPARLFLIETEGLGTTIVHAMREAQAVLTSLILEGVAAEPAEKRRRGLQSAGAVAGVARIASIWIAEDYEAPLDEVVEAALNLFSELLRLPSPSPQLLIGG